MGLILFAAGLALGTVAHEFGHAAAAWLLGYRVFLVSIGRGPVLLQVRLGGGCGLTVHAVPTEGLVVAFPRHKPRRLPQLLFYLSGAAGNAAVFAALAVAAAWDVLPRAVAQPLAVAQLILILFSLLPARFRQESHAASGRLIPSDGRAVLSLLRRGVPDTSAILGAYLVTSFTGQPAPDPLPLPPLASLWELSFHMARQERALTGWDRRHASDALRRLLRDGGLAGPLRAVTLDLLLENEVLYGATGADPASLHAWSEEAVALLPHPAVEATRACLLLAHDRTDQGTALMRSVLAQTDGAFVTALGHAFLAQAAARQGDAAAATGLLQQARAPLSRITDEAHRHRLLSLVAGIEAAALPPDRYGANSPTRPSRLLVTPAGLLASVALAAGLTWLATYSVTSHVMWNRGFHAACRWALDGDGTEARDGTMAEVCADPPLPPTWP